MISQYVLSGILFVIAIILTPFFIYFEKQLDDMIGVLYVKRHFIFRRMVSFLCVISWMLAVSLLIGG